MMLKSNLLLPIAIFSLSACSPNIQHHLHNDIPPSTPSSLASNNGKTGSAAAIVDEAQLKAQAERAEKDAELRKNVFQFMQTLNIPTAPQLLLPTYSDNEPLEYFVTSRCKSLVEALASAPKNKMNLYDRLLADFHLYTFKAELSSICEQTNPATTINVVPGKLISREYSLAHFVGENEAEVVEIVLRPDLTVSGYSISEGPDDKNTRKSVYFENGRLIAYATEKEMHSVFTSLDRFEGHLVVTALDGSYDYKEDDIPYSRDAYISMGQSAGTEKVLHVTHFQNEQDLEATEFVPATRPLTFADDQSKASCLIDLKASGDAPAYLVHSDSQCFAEMRY
jgi:hypothetical protein